ncbi:uncharacterized protein LOC133044015 [Dama dama]|uniref:uncharacterized protein LOC133044015 n=1 Tax=Dama dama TaxID=30532 RepID=UPI002A363FAC|nr:uncharacterized protein LOC133044015 [Dama dama]
MLKLKLQYFGHLKQRADSFEKTLMLGKRLKDTNPEIPCKKSTALRPPRWISHMQALQLTIPVETSLPGIFTKYQASGMQSVATRRECVFAIFINLGPSTMSGNFIFCLSYFHFLFKGLWKSNLRPLSGRSYRFSGPSSGSCHPVLGVGLSAAVFSRNCWTGPEGTCRPICNSMSGSSTFGRWSSPFTLNFLPSRGLSCSSQLITGVEIRLIFRRVLTGVGATHAQNFSPCIHPALLLLGDGAEESHRDRAMRDRLTEDASEICPGPVTARSLGSGMEAWMELGKVPEEQEPAEGMAPTAVAIFSPGRWPVSLEDMTLTSAQCPMAAMAGTASGGFSRFLRRHNKGHKWYGPHISKRY